MKTLMIYGAAGYTGSMAAEHAVAAKLDIVLAGRERDRASLAERAETLGARYRIFGLENAGAIDEALDGISVLLNCAGPFKHTAEPLMVASIRRGMHYLDISAEIDSYQLAQAIDAEAGAVGVMLLPGSGGSVAMLGCLAVHAVSRVPDARKISIALHVSGGISRGSAVTATENLAPQALELVDGELKGRSPDEVRDFDFGSGSVTCFPVTLPDLLTIQRATGVANVETFVHATGGAFPSGDLIKLPAGPTTAERDANRYQAAVEVSGADGGVVRSVLDTVNGYSFTSLAAAEAARRVLMGEFRPGFQTPAGLFGNGFAETIADTRIVDI